MSRANPLLGAPRIHGELLKLGIDIGETNVGKYMIRHRKPPTQTWRTFMKNHIHKRDGSSDRGMDGPATSQCVPLGLSALLSIARPGSNLWRQLHQTGSGPGHRTGAECATIGKGLTLGA
jgi:hypothetical protein